MSLQAKASALLARLLLRASHRALEERLIRFRGLVLFVPRGVFNPLLAGSTAMLDEAGCMSGRILDVGTGTGVLALLAARRDASLAIGYDESPLAIAAARINARLNGLGDKALFTSSWREVVYHAPYDSVLVNPPYLPLEPRDSLDTLWCGGRDLRVPRAMLRRAAALLRPWGRLCAASSSIAEAVDQWWMHVDAGLVLKPCRAKPYFPDRLVLLCGVKAPRRRAL